MSETILYAGVGPHREPAMIEAITGERASLVATAFIIDAALWVQRMDQTPDVAIAEGVPTPRQILVPHWKAEGEAYGLREEIGSVVIANLFDVSQLGLCLIRDWELVELNWKEQRDVKVRVRSRAGGILSAVTEFLPEDQPTVRKINGLVHPTYLNDEEKMHLLAKAARKEYLSNHNVHPK